MTLSKEYSIIADSTMSLSSPESSPVVKRAAKTYGRRREPEVFTASSSCSDATSIGSPCSIYQTGPAGLDEEIPPTSDAPCTHSEPEQVDDEGNDSDEEGTGNSAGFEFSWKKQLRAIDEEDDDDDLVASNVATQAAFDASLSPTRAKNAAAPLGSESSNNSLALPLSARSTHSPRPSSLQPSSNDLTTTTRTSTASPRRRSAIPNSDSEVSPLTKSSSHPATSPQGPHPINTPESGPSSTPPTSDDEMPTNPFAKGKLRKQSTTRCRLSLTPQPLGEDVPSSSTRESGKGKQTSSPTRSRPAKKGKSRAPTKKELEETTRARARLAVDQHVSIPRTEVPQKYSITEFFSKLNPSPEAFAASNQLSDPIGQFSSPPIVKMAAVGRPTSPPPKLAEISLPPNGDDSDDEFPAEVPYARERQAQRNVDLREVKRKALAAQQLRPQEDSDDDLLVVDNATAARDMHMVAQEAAKERRSLKKRHLGPSQGKRIIERFGYAPSRKGEKLQTQVNAKLFASVEAQRRTEVEKKQAEWKRRGGTLKSETDPIVALKGGEDVRKVYAEKVLNAANEEGDEEDMADDSDEEWVPDEAQSRMSEPAEIEDLIANGGSGSGSGSGSGDEDTTMVDAENEIPLVSSQEATEHANAGPSFRRSRVVKVVDSDDEDENVRPQSQFERVQGSAPNSPSSIALASSPSSLQVIVDRTSLSSFDEDENDKENNTRLMFDRSDDKENHAVVRHGLDARPTLGSRQSSLRHLDDEVMRGISVSPSQQSDRLDDETGEVGLKARKPLKEIDADPFASPSTSTSFTARLLNASPRDATTSPTQASQSPFLGKRFSPLNLDDFDPSQTSDENEAIDGFKVPALQTSFSQLYESQTQAAGPSARGGGLDKLRKPEALNELPLTLDVTLQPALDVSENVRKKADSVFEKEQEYLIDALQPKQSTQPQLFINDHGFLTQTRPDVGSPDIYKMFSPSQRTPLLRSRTQPSLSQDSSVTQATLTSQSRHPLRTLSMLGELDPDTPDISPLRRLRRRRSSSPSSQKDAGYDSSPSQSPVKKSQPLLNAFDVLKRNAAHRSDGSKPERNLNLGKEFVEAEAEESDDDMGYWGPRKKDEEEEEEALEADKTLVEMMDDKDMDEEVVAANRVLEKFQEQVLEDDEKLQKLHQDAVDGKLRNKRRNRVDLDGSDDESDEDADAIRRRLHKRPKTDRNDIQALGKAEETKAFFNTYQDDLVDNDQVMWVGLSQDDPTHPGDTPDEESDRSEDDEDREGREEKPQQVVSAHEIRRQVLERLIEGEIETINVHDVSWIDGRDDGDDGDEINSKVRVKDVNAQAKSGVAAFKKKAWMDVDLDLDVETMQPRSSTASSASRSGVRSLQNQPKASFTDFNNEGGEEGLDPGGMRLKQWAKMERRSGRLESTGRSVGGAAVTGHKGAGGIRMKGSGTFTARELGKKTSLGGTGRGGAASGGSVRTREKAGVEKTKSMVLGNVDRKMRFE